MGSRILHGPSRRLYNNRSNCHQTTGTLRPGWCWRPRQRQHQQQHQPQLQHKHHRQFTACRVAAVEAPPDQRCWQQELLGSMHQHYLADLDSSSSSTTTTSCALIDPMLDACYDNIDGLFFSKGGCLIPPQERKLIDATGGSSTYGEIHSAGLDQLLRYLALDSSSVFMDLGCGRGRAVLQVAAHSPAAACIGLELSDSRLEQAEMALQQLQGWVPLRPVEFRCADLSTCSLQDGTHLYLCSTAFGAGICRSIAQRLAASPNFQVLVTSRMLPIQPYLYKLGEVPCAYSHTGDGRAHIYVKSLAHAPPAVLARLWCKDGMCWLPGTSQMQLSIAEDVPITAINPAKYVALAGDAAVAGGAADALEYGLKPQGQQGGPATE